MNTNTTFKTQLKGLSKINLESLVSCLFDARCLMESCIPDEAIEEGHWVTPELSAIHDMENLAKIELHSR